MQERLVKLISTFFYVGEVPFASGTLGSFVGLLIILSVSDFPCLRVALFALILGLGFFSAGRSEKIFNKKDPHEVVIDEVAGIFLVFFMVPIRPINILAGFFLYRVFDVAKPFGVRRLEKLKGSWGIMTDDILSGIYVNLILHILLLSRILH